MIFDVNYRARLWEDDVDAAREAFEEILPLCHVVRAAAPEETEIVAGEKDPVEGARALAARGPSTVLIGCGVDGAVLCAAGAVERIPAPAVACVDTTGAGDAMTGAFVHGLLAGVSASTAARLGVAAGSLAVTRRGGASAIPRGEEVVALSESMKATSDA